MFVKVVLALGLTSGLLMTTASPAYAGEAGRNCQTFYAQNNPASGWGYTVCVKLLHDTSTHQWWATESVSSTTPGIRLYIYDLFMNYHVYIDGQQGLNAASVSGSGSTFVTGLTYKEGCSGSITLSATASGYAIWPNGTTSYPNGVSTSPYETQGTC